MTPKLLLCLFFMGSLAFAQLPGGKNYRFKPEELKFQLIPYEGDDTGGQTCTHRLQHELAQDWSVLCGSKKFTVHLWLTEYRRESIPQLSIELLYWVSDQSDPRKAQDTGTTLWYHFKQVSDLYAISAKQGVDNDTAGLYLDIKPLSKK